MYRREALRRLAAVSIAATLAGCGSGASSSGDAHGPPEPPEGGGPDVESESDPLAVTSIDYREDDSGSLVLVVAVANRDDQSRSGTLRATVRVGDEETVETADVTVAADDSETVEVPFDASFADFERNGSVDLEIAEE